MKRSFLLACLVALSLALAAPAWAAPKFTLKFGGTFAPDHPGSLAQQAIADELEKEREEAAMQQEAERLSTTETGQARAFNQGRASAFKLALEDLREAGQ